MISSVLKVPTSVIRELYYKVLSNSSNFQTIWHELCSLSFLWALTGMEWNCLWNCIWTFLCESSYIPYFCFCSHNKISLWEVENALLCWTLQKSAVFNVRTFLKLQQDSLYRYYGQK
jgi:hypothetical protein